MLARLRKISDDFGFLSPSNFGILMVFTAMFLLRSIIMNSDANWDLLNYHIYNPFALFNKPFDFDIAPGMTQTYLNPAMDIPPYFIREYLNDYPKLANCLLVIPHIIAVYLVYLVGMRVIPSDVPHRAWLSFIATFFGASGTASLPPMGTCQSDMMAAMCLSGAVLLIIRTIDQRGYSVAAILGAGILAGASVSLKLTLAPFMIAIFVAMLVIGGDTWLERFKSTFLLGLGATLGLAAVGGPWWVVMYTHYDSPLFPYFNNVFHSPWYAPNSMSDGRFFPHSFLPWVFYPFKWLAKQNTADQWIFRDWRYAITYVAVVVAVVGAWRNRLRTPNAAAWYDRKSLFILIFVAISYIIWEEQFSILRYLGPLELFLGFAVLVAIQPLLAQRPWRHGPHVAMLGLTLICMATTAYPGQPRTKDHTPIVRITMPDLPPDAMVLLLDDEPMGFIAAYAPTSVRFIGVNNNMMRPGVAGLMQQRAEALIRDQQGPIYGASAGRAEVSQQSLDYYHLRRTTDCTKISANILFSPIQFCRLERQP